MTIVLTLAFFSGFLVGGGLGIFAGIYYIKKKTEKQMENAMEEMGQMFNPETISTGKANNE